MADRVRRYWWRRLRVRNDLTNAYHHDVAFRQYTVDFVVYASRNVGAAHNHCAVERALPVDDHADYDHHDASARDSYHDVLCLRAACPDGLDQYAA
ncbi:hypothetical protein BH10ACT9_BH10ACT9_09350 [soil metagenome]